MRNSSRAWSRAVAGIDDMNVRHPLAAHRVIRHQGEIAALGGNGHGLGAGPGGQARDRHKPGAADNSPQMGTIYEISPYRADCSGPGRRVTRPRPGPRGRRVILWSKFAGYSCHTDITTGCNRRLSQLPRR